MPSSPSGLDLTGQASEDEPAYRASPQSTQQQSSEKQRHRITSQSKSAQSVVRDLSKTSNKNQSANTNDDSNSTPSRRGIGALSRLPSPIDLWQSRTITSLLLLPIVFILYVILQLPLHHNSTTEKNHWRGRAKDVDKLSSELNIVEKELDTVKDDQKYIKKEVSSLRRRLGKMKKRRGEREELARIRERERERQEQEELEKQKQQQGGGVAKGGPITTVTMAKALAVSTFAGKPNNNDDDGLVRKKDD